MELEDGVHPMGGPGAGPGGVKAQRLENITCSNLPAKGGCVEGRGGRSVRKGGRALTPADRSGVLQPISGSHGG